MTRFIPIQPIPRIFSVPDSYHEILCEKKIYRESVISMAIEFFGQKEDESAELVQPKGPIFEGDFESNFSLSKAMFKTSGVIVALGIGIAGMSMIINGRRR